MHLYFDSRILAAFIITWQISMDASKCQFTVWSWKETVIGPKDFRDMSTRCFSSKDDVSFKIHVRQEFPKGSFGEVVAEVVQHILWSAYWPFILGPVSSSFAEQCYAMLCHPSLAFSETVIWKNKSIETIAVQSVAYKSSDAFLRKIKATSRWLKT